MNSRNLPDNSKIRISSEGDTRHINEYYISVSRYYKLAKFITLLILVLFVLLMVSVFRDDITSENFRYMLKNLDMQTDSVVESYSTVEFESPSETEVSLFGSNLAVCTKNKLTLFNLSGRKVLSEDVNLTNPIINTDGRYIMAYEMGQNSISLFNSFAKVYEETLDFPISDVASSNNGYFLVVTKTREYTSCVVLYDSEFDVINRVFKDKHVMCVDIKDNADEFLVASFYANGGILNTEIMACEPLAETSTKLMTIEDTFPIDVNYFDDGGYCLVCDNATYFFTPDGTIAGEYKYTGKLLSGYEISDEYTVLTFNKNIVGDATDVIILSKLGEQILQTSTADRVTSLASSGNKLYMLLDSSIGELNIETGEVSYADTKENPKGIFLSSGHDAVVITYTSSADIIKIDDAFRKEETSDVPLTESEQSDATD